MFVLAGVGFQLLQIGVSVWQRKANLDNSGDPWDGRTLEWSTTSPAPFYNFAVLPEVSERDAFWAMKQAKSTAKPQYNDIHLPRNSGMGILIAGLAFVFGFAIVWHIWCLAVIALLSIITSIIVRTTAENTEYIVTASEIEKIEALS
jgi:cytochrome o ubiquinol oxidase subunit 1